MTRLPQFAGQFYPADKQKLQNQIQTFLNQATVTEHNQKLKALIVPHAGYIFSGPVAAWGYKLLKQNQHIDNIFLLGPSHHYRFKNLGLVKYNKWQTLLGTLTISDLQNTLAQSNYFNFLELQAQDLEHSLEVQLPFLQTILKHNFELTPILTGFVTDHQAIATELTKYLKLNTLLIISTDLSHFLPYDEATEMDQATIKKILNLNPEINQEAACGLDGIKILIELAKEQNWQAKLLKYQNSGDTAGPKDSVVGYAAIGFW